MAPPEVSVVIPACAAETTIGRAVASVLESRGVAAEVVLVANDEADYQAVLDLPPESAGRVRFARTPAPRSGPSFARNLGMEKAEGALLAFLDADDFYAPDRLARLAPLAREHGAATGPCLHVPEAEAHLGCGSTGGDLEGDSLSLETIVASRRSFSPVLRRDLAGPWRAVRFAEDMIFNAELHCRAGAYAYDPGAAYGYVQTARSGTRGPGSLERAICGYGDILGQLFEFDLSPPARALLFRQMLRDLDDAGAAHFAGGAEDWRQAVRDLGVRSAPLP